MFHLICFKAGSFLFQGIILLLISFIYFADLLMEGKGRFGTQYEENGIRSDCWLKIQGMSDLFGHECVDIAWDDYLLDDDRIVPHHGSKRFADHCTMGENNKRCRRELASNSNKYVDHRKEKNSTLPLSETRGNMSEKDSWSSKLRGPFTYGSDEELIKEAPSLVSDSTMSSPHGLNSNNRDINSTDLPKHPNNSTSLVDDNSTNFPIGDVNNTGKDLGFFEHAQNKDSSDLLYYDWSEIENFDDIDRMFRSDSRLGIEVCREDELSWLSSADDIGGPQDALKSDAKFSCPDPSEVKTISENHDFLNGYSPNNFAMSDVPSRYEDCSWTSEKSDSYTSILTGPDFEDSKDGFISPKQGIGCNAKFQPSILTSSLGPGDAAVMIEHKNQMKLQSRSDSLSQISEQQNDIMKPCSGLTSDQAFAPVHVQKQQQTSDSGSCLENPISNIHLKDSHLSDPSLVNMEQAIVKSETNDVSISSRDSHHASGLLKYTDGFSGPPFKDTSLIVCGQREKVASCQGILSSGHDSLKNGSVAVQASVSDPGLVGKYENRCDPQGVSSAFAAEMGSSNMQQSSTMVPNLDDISLEAASFRQLQLVTKQLDLRTKLCIRDSLYRLAHSAEQRRRNLNLNSSFGEERDAAAGASEAEVTERCSSLMDMETDTNPIDRSVAHLLFHRPSDSSFMSPGVVHGSVASLPALSDSLVSEEEG